MLIQEEVKEIYVWEDVQEWQPTANTLAYYKLDGNLNDSSGHGYNLSGSSATSYVTLSSGEKVASNSGTGIIGTTSSISLSTSGKFTVSTWCKMSNVNQCIWGYGQGTSSGATYYGTGVIYISGKLIIWKYRSDVATNVSVSPNTRTNIIYCYDNGTSKIYINGVLSYTGTNSHTFSGTRLLIGGNLINNTDWYNGQFDEFILENKVRTATEISDYYNLTKSQYGL